MSHTTTIPPHRGKYSAQFENYYRKIVILRATKYYPSMNQSIPFFRHHSLYTDTHKRHRRYIMWMSANKFLLVIYFPMAWCCLIFAFHETNRCNTSVSCWAVYQSIQIESDLFFFRFLNSQLDANEKLMFDKQHISKFNFDFTRNALLFVFGSETKRNIINKRYLYVTVIILFMKVNDAICVLRSPAAHEMRGKMPKRLSDLIRLIWIVAGLLMICTCTEAFQNRKKSLKLKLNHLENVLPINLCRSLPMT